MDTLEELQAALVAPDTQTRRKAAATAFRLKEPALLPALITALADQDEEVRAWAAKTLGMLGDVAALEPLLAAIQDSSPRVRRSVIVSLRRLKDPRAIEPLLAALNDPVEYVRKIAIRELGVFKDSRAVEPLMNLLRFSSDNSAFWIVNSLALIGDKRSLNVVIEAFKAGYTSYDITLGLAATEDDRVVDLFVEKLKNSEDTKSFIARSLATMRNERAVRNCIELLKDFDAARRTRSWILWFIPYGCADSVVEAVRYVTDNDPNPSIREHALSQLERLSK